MVEVNKDQTPWMTSALKFKGLQELEGYSRNNPAILQMYNDAGSPQSNDEVPWCSAMVNSAFYRAKLPQYMTKNLTAKSWLTAPQMTKVSLKNLRYGDIVVMHRGDPSSWQGHVAFFVRWTKDGRMVLFGGNQNDEANETAYSTAKFAGARRPIYTPPVEQYKPAPAPDLPVPKPKSSKTEKAGWSAACGGLILGALQSPNFWIGAAVVVSGLIVAYWYFYIHKKS
jgi:uncharacterized protein (TIGR02594 family)